MQLAQSYLQGMASPFDGVLEAYGQGQTLRQNRDLLQAQQAEQARKIQAQQALETIDWNDMGAVRRVVAQYPEYTAGAKEYYGQMEAKEKEGLFRTMSRGASALQSGSNQVAADLFKSQAEGYRNVGDEDAAETADWLAEMSVTNPQAAQRALMLQLASVGGKDTAAAYASLSGANIAEDAAPYTNANTQATTGKLTSDRVNTVNQDISNAAIGKDPAAFSTVITRQYENGLINKEDYDYMMTNIKDPEKAGSYLRGLAMGNPAIAAAYKPTTAYVNQGDKITAVEVDPYDGTSRTTGTYGVSASPNTVYATDASERNNVRSVNQSNINSERTAKTAAERNAIAKHVADTKAQVAAGKLTQQVLPDGRVVVFNTKGQMRPVIDPETGDPLISKKADPSIAGDYRKEKVRQEKLDVLLTEIEPLIKDSTGSVPGTGLDFFARGFGVTTKGAESIARLKTLSGQLVAMMPRMEGPQSDKDVAMYKEMAGNLASTITPRKMRLAALDTIKALNEKYADLNESSQVKTDDLF
ncbi:hypothetical protein ACTXLJ_05440 [Psychrobacter celer]|uniref:hypothetical protein n=1 Tax=Psychrobacter celer TaxID=306572 RepID=UPI003FD22EAB